MKWLIVALAIPLAACGGKVTDIKVTLNEPTKLELKRPEPLQLEPFSIEVRTVNGKAEFVMREEDYTVLERNLETIQGRLQLYNTMLDQYRDFYEGSKGTLPAQ